jgi:hypothetical protein
MFTLLGMRRLGPIRPQFHSRFGSFQQISFSWSDIPVSRDFKTPQIRMASSGILHRVALVIGVHSALVRVNEELRERKVAAPV